METRRFEGIEPTVSRIGLGAWAIGGFLWGGTDESESIRTIHAALERGITLIDTAPVYGFGVSEETVGKALAEAGSRDQVVISTKAGLEWRGKEIIRNSSPRRIMREATDSLKRLRTDYIDIYFIHWPDPMIPYEETAEAMGRLYDDGKIRAIGVSNYHPKQIEAFRKAAPIHFCQPPYNLFERSIEDDIIPYCRDNSIVLMTYGALCRGLLTGKVTPEREFIGDDLRKGDPKFQPPRLNQYLEAVKLLDSFARENYGKKAIHLALRWILDKGVNIALWGARHPEQLEPLGEIMGWHLDTEAIETMERIVAETIKNPVGSEFMAPPVPVIE